MRIKFGKNNIPVEIFANYQLKRIMIPLPGFEKEVVCRLNETDPEVFTQVFVRNDYRHVILPPHADVIIDAGANVGYSVFFFRGHYPEATIIALEPNPKNFAILQENCGHLPNVILLQAALWKSCTTLQLQFTSDDGKSLGSWGTRTVEGMEQATETTEALDVFTLMQRFNFSEIDIFKIDIEGAEKEVFSDPNAAWYSSVKLFVLETHERFAKGADSNVKAALPQGRWQYAKKGENQFFNRVESV